MKIKAILIISGLIIFWGTTITAQEFKFGILAGLDVVDSRSKTAPDINLDDYFVGESNPMASYNINAFASYKSAGILGFSIEPGFIKKGYKHKGYREESRFEFNYIHMPLLADFYMNDKLYLSIGPEIGILISDKIKSKDHTAEIGIVDNLELSGLIGLNYNISEKLGLGLRYNRGFTHTIKYFLFDAEGNIESEVKEYNQYFQLQVRYKLFSCSKKKD